MTTEQRSAFEAGLASMSIALRNQGTDEATITRLVRQSKQIYALACVTVATHATDAAGGNKAPNYLQG